MLPGERTLHPLTRDLTKAVAPTFRMFSFLPYTVTLAPCRLARVHWQEMILKWRSKEWCVLSVHANWLITVCHSNLRNTLCSFQKVYFLLTILSVNAHHSTRLTELTRHRTNTNVNNVSINFSCMVKPEVMVKTTDWEHGNRSQNVPVWHLKKLQLVWNYCLTLIWAIWGVSVFLGEQTMIDWLVQLFYCSA